MTYLVIGGTGRVASHLTRLLLDAGAPVRLLVRDAAKARTAFATTGGGPLQIVDGAFNDPAVLARAFDGATAAFQALGTSREQVALERGLIAAAARAQLPHLVRLSALGADPDTLYEIGRRHGVLDDELREVGLQATVLRPAWFSSNLLWAAPWIARSGRWTGSAPTGRIAAIDTRDVSAVAAAVMLQPELRGGTIELSGPQALTFQQMAGRFSAVLGRPVQYAVANQASLRAGRIAAGIPDWLVDISLGIDTAMEANLNAEVTGAVLRYTGRAARPIDEFIRDNREAFTATPQS